MPLALPRALAGYTTGSTDPIRYYTRPGIGWLFRRRIEMGLEMIPVLPSGSKALEVGYAAGIVLFNLAPKVAELYGVDLDADAVGVEKRLLGLGVKACLARGSVLEMGDLYADGLFDLVVCFSVMEHLPEPARALNEVHRVLKPGGTAIIGMPAVNRAMEYAFCAIGFKGIEDHHVTTPAQVWRIVTSEPARWEVDRSSLPAGVPLELGLYHAFRLRKR